MSVSPAVQKKLYKDFRKLDSFGLWLEDCGGIYYFGQDPDVSPSERALTQSRKLVKNVSFDLSEPLNLDKECDINDYYKYDGLLINGWNLFFSEKFLYELQIFYAKVIVSLKGGCPKFCVNGG